MNNQTSRCSLCLSGANITLPTKQVNIPGFEYIDTCQTLASIVPIVLLEDSEDCHLLRSIGSLCGCPKQENACNLCADGSKPQYPWLELEFLADSFNGIVPTCEILEAGLHSFNQTDSFCRSSQDFLSEYCGCGALPGSVPSKVDESNKCTLCSNGDPMLYPDKLIDIEGLPFQTCSQLSDAAETLFQNKELDSFLDVVQSPCYFVRRLATYCGCQSDVQDPCPICNVEKSTEAPFPEQLLDESLTGPFFFSGVQLSCGHLAEISKTFSQTAELERAICSGLQGLGTQCGCSIPDQPSCDFCPNSAIEDLTGLVLSTVPPYDQVSCGFAKLGSMFLQNGDEIPIGLNGDLVEYDCAWFRKAGIVCGCDNGMYLYWGADTLRKQKAAIWIQRTTAILSIIGSIAIMVDIFRLKTYTKRMYHQIMLGLSFFDFCSSIAWGLGPLPTTSDIATAKGIDSSTFGLDGVGFYGSYGNEASCKAQGFLLFWGFTSILYNVVLTYFFKLSVIDRWSDGHFSRWARLVLLGGPAIIGTIVALAAIPFVTFTPVACTVGSYNDPGGWPKLIGLFFIPYGPAFVYIPITTFYIYWKVRTQSRRAERWRFDKMIRIRTAEAIVRDRSGLGLSTRRSNNAVTSRTERLVFWQSLRYVIAFFASYAIFLVAFALDGQQLESYWFYMLLSILTPMQGFFNSLIYFRSKILKCLTWCTRNWSPVITPKKKSEEKPPVVEVETKSEEHHTAAILTSELFPTTRVEETLRKEQLGIQEAEMTEE